MRDGSSAANGLGPHCPPMNSLQHSARLLGVLLVILLAGCKSSPDKRLIQYLNTDGFGNRFSGNAEEENYVTLGDKIQVSDSYNDAELQATAEVDIDGTVLLPEVGAVHVAGMTRSQIEAFLMEKYSPYYDLLDITVRIKAAKKFYYIYGEVDKTGRLKYDGDLTLFDAVMEARPNKDTANLGRVRIIKADPRDPLIITADVAAVIADGDSTYNINITERDIIYVPPTMLAQIGYFLDTLLFPVKQVLSGLSQAVRTLYDLSAIQSGYGGYGRRGVFY
jgi:protein involved in polysaccharide export with SLBB domain